MSTLALSLVRRRPSLWGVAALIAAMATGLTVYSYLSWVRSQIPVAGKLVPVVVANRDIQAGETLDSQNVGLKKHPEKYLPPLALRGLGQALGRHSTVPINKGETITSRKIGSKGGLSSIVPAGMRAYSLRIDSGAGMTFLPKPGDRVDVLVTFAREVLGEPTSMTVLRAREVASIGNAGGETQSGKVSSKIGLTSAGEVSLGVTLFVTPEEAERLAMAESLGRITLVLAPLNADMEDAPAPIKPQNLSAR